ncbi:alpha-L-fucosidase [Coraliomargarita algicola]|uniref:alpha-L-fucosidase n=1 Tax=Coraliomargarita algicola TaxID=3092156 RepID=A0ABZ0RJ60_9BACT|nr:alpha-L-fucosidase [Coraliomargarita sp. J2-16]WPJ96239.1 alpha-L-fucosidase [Coraliomargarita sp. J2-16]
MEKCLPVTIAGLLLASSLWAQPLQTASEPTGLIVEKNVSLTANENDDSLSGELKLPMRAAEQIPAADAGDQERMQWWREAKYGMFIHWGLYAEPARGEWVMIDEEWPVADYAALAKDFNPTAFDATEWVNVAKEAGMKYMVITAKHHDGFAMYDSEVSPFNIVDATPYKKDPLKALSEACEQAGIQFGIYYSQAFDWYHPGGKIPRGGAWDPAQEGSFDDYFNEIAIPQIQEIIKGYNPHVIWFDMPAGMTDEKCRQMMDVIRGLKPGMIVNSRLKFTGPKTSVLQPDELTLLRELGVDYLTYRDREIPETTLWRDWETCMTLNHSWGFTEGDEDWKDAKTIIEMLGRVVNMDGNFLLNFGPTAEGRLPTEAVKSVKEAGAWLKVNGEAVYGVRASELKDFDIPKATRAPNGRLRSVTPKVKWLATARPADAAMGAPAKLYIQIFEWPGSTLEITGIEGKVKRAYFLADATQSPLTFQQKGELFSVELPQTAPDPIATVVCLELAE